jgi:hypothetical protein
MLKIVILLLISVGFLTIGMVLCYFIDKIVNKGINKVESKVFLKLKKKNPDVIFCGDVWRDGQIVDKKTFKGQKSSNQYINSNGVVEGTCHKVAENFFIRSHFAYNKEEIIGYCKKHMPNCSCKYPGRVISDKEAYDMIAVQQVMTS